LLSEGARAWQEIVGGGDGDGYNRAGVKPALLQWVSERHDPFSDPARAVPGPTLQLLRADGWRGAFGRAILLCNQDSEERARALAAELDRLGVPAEVRCLAIADVTDLNELHAATGREIGRIAAAGDPLVVHLSPGPPLAQTLWYLMAASGELNARLVKTVPPRHRRDGAAPEVVEVRQADLGPVRSMLRAKEGHSLAAPPAEPVAVDPAMKRAVAQARRLAGSKVPILLLGETGTGKEVLARYIHGRSGRDPLRFVAVNCAEADRTVADSELFGYVKGAFTGAETDRPGLIEAAAGGTLFLDEVADAPTAIQAKLLRFLHSGEYRPVGAAAARGADVRIVAAVQPDGLGRLRADFRYRLEGERIEVPPLRSRPKDIPELARHAARRAAGEERLPVPALSEAAMAALQRHDWPGNVRELEQAVRRAVVLSGGGELLPAHLPDAVLRGGGGRLDLRKGPIDDKAAARERIGQALVRAGSVAGGARLLGISEPTLRSHMRRLKVRRPKV